MRFLDWTAPDVAADLALDEALLQEAEDEGAGPVLRLWERPDYAVVMGASGRRGEEVRLEACAVDGVSVARRSSGGGTVVIGPGALNATVVLPREAAPELDAVDSAQAYVLGRIALRLSDEGRPVDVLGSGDLTLRGRKFAGSAQRRLRRCVMVHVTILYRFELDRISRYVTQPARQPKYRENRSHEDFVTNLNLSREAVAAAVRSAWLPEGASLVIATIPEGRIRELVATKFADRGWIERL